MKKLFVAVAAVVMCMTLVSCQSVEDKARSYADKMKVAVEAGDYEKVEELAKECEDWLRSLTPEEQQRAAQVAVEGFE